MMKKINVWMSLMSQWVMSQKAFKILFNFGMIYDINNLLVKVS